MLLTRNKDGSWSAFSRFMGKRFVVDAETMASAMRQMMREIKKHYREMEVQNRVIH